jgi:hypothetical protein
LIFDRMTLIASTIEFPMQGAKRCPALSDRIV